MASYAREEGLLRVEGEIASEDIDDLLTHGAWLLDSGQLASGSAGARLKAGPSEVTLDLDSVSPVDSSLVGAIAQLGSDARLKSKTLVVRASGRAADLLSWAGLHRLVTLHISPARVGV